LVSSYFSKSEYIFAPTFLNRARANQKAALAGVVHEAKVDPKIGQLIAALEGAQDLTLVQKANLREVCECFTYMCVRFTCVYVRVCVCARASVRVCVCVSSFVLASKRVPHDRVMSHISVSIL
jgi:hypothetical protein